MSRLKAVYDACNGMRRMLSHVLATGNREWVMNSRLGFGEKPTSGEENQNIFQRDTFSTVEYKKRKKTT